MPRGITPTRARRRQSDAKWRASVAICYEIMKNVIPDHKKLGRRKVSKALTLKETERHIVNLEAALGDLINRKAEENGKVLMIEKKGDVLYPASLDDVKQDFATKQLSFFASTNTGKKRYNVPADIEASLENLSAQVCPLMALNQDGIVAGETTPADQPAETTVTSDQGSACVVSLNEDYCAMNNDLLPLGVAYIKMEQVDHLVPDLSQKTPLKTRTNVAGNHGKVILPEQTPPTARSVGQYGQQGHQQTHWTPLTGSYGQRETVMVSGCNQASLDGRSNLDITPLKDKRKSSFTCTSTPSSGGGRGFTPVKLPLGLDLLSPSTPGKHTFESAFSPFSLTQTSSSCLSKGLDYLDFTDVEENAHLFCTESIENIDLDEAIVPTSTPGQSQDSGVLGSCVSEITGNYVSPSQMPWYAMIRIEQEVRKVIKRFDSVTENNVTGGFSQRKPKTEKKCRRRLDQSYPSKTEKQENSFEKQDDCSDKQGDSCLDFDGYLLFYRQHAGSLDSAKDKALAITKLWESLGRDERATYTEMASLENSDDSNDLSDDLLEIEVKPFYSPYGKSNTSGSVGTGSQRSYNTKHSQQVPDLGAHTNLLSAPRPNLFSGMSSFSLETRSQKGTDPYVQLIPEYEDLGIIYSQDDEFDNSANNFESCQVVPDWVPS